jgi:hypothetical protein
VTYAQPPHLFRNLGARKFEVASASSGEALRKAVVGRGAAYGDYDRDGDLDILMTANGGPARLLRNDLAEPHRAVRIGTVGVSSNRDGIGAKIRLTFDNGTRSTAMVKTGSSYLSQSELPVTFGLGASANVSALEIVWPTGKAQAVSSPAAGEWITVQEDRGITRRVAFERKPH